MSRPGSTIRRFNRRVYTLVYAVVTLSITAGLMIASLANAGKGVVGVFGSSGSGDGQFANAYGTAVNLATGDVYVVDQFGNRVERFDANGGFLGAFGWGVADGSSAAQTCASGCQPGLQGNGDGQFDTPQGIAIDQSDGSVYVVDGNNNRVEKFSAAGVYQSQFGAAGSAEGQLSGPQGIAVDPTDRSVYVADANNNRVEHFSSAGAFVGMFGFGVADGSSTFETCTSTCQAGVATGDPGSMSAPTRVAVDSTGQVYALDSGNGRIERYTAANTFDQVIDPTDVSAPQEIAIGPANDDLYVAQWAQDFSEHHVIEIDGTGTLVDTHAVGSGANQSSGLALNAASQKIYLADGFNARVFILDDVTAPTVTIDPPTGVTSTGASLSGTVNPNGNSSMGWHFETSTNDVSWTRAGADQDPGSGNSPVPVSQVLTGLLPNATYFVRLVAQRAFNASVISSEVQFTTPAVPPDVSTGTADDVTPDHAVLTGLITPRNNPTTYYFEYGPTTAYGTSLPATQDADAGSSNNVGAVLQRIDGLRAGATYHYRLVATNSAETVHGQDQAFTTGTPLSSTPRTGIPDSGFLPDNRGWEKVSPDDKNGGDITADSGRTSAAGDGNAVTLSSLSAFGDARGTSVATDYMSMRGAGRWVTHAITPPQAPTTVPAILRTLQSLYVGYSGDLSSAAFLSWSPVTNDPNVASVINLYRRDDAKSPGAGSYQLVSACPLCASASTPLPPLLGNIGGGGSPRFAGASADFEHVIFESQQPLTSDAPSGCSDLTDLEQCPGNLYEWDHGTLRLAGILPDSACGTPPCPAHGSQAGQGAGAFHSTTNLTPHTISADGSRIFFTVPDSPGSPSGSLYMRSNHSTTVQLNMTERTPAAGGPQSATYWDASADGARVFFTSSEALTDDAIVGGRKKLYMYDATKPASDPHNLTLLSPDAQPADGGDVIQLLGSNSDGHYAYFAAAGQLVAGQPVLGGARGLYAWHDGTLRYITSMRDFGADSVEDTNTNSWSFSQPTARVTPDGLHLLFSSSVPAGGPTGYDQGACGSLDTGCREFYLYSYGTQRLACVSCNPSGAPASAGAFAAERTHIGGSATSPAQNHPLSQDGRRVFFSTAEALVPHDDNHRADVYEYDVPSGTVHLITSGADRSDSYFMDASPSGNDVFFLTRAQLVGSDKDNNYDMYDARVDGGFAEPLSAHPPCSGDLCQGPQSVAPGFVDPSTVSLSGLGDLKPVVKKVTSKPLTRSQKLKKALRKCKMKRKKSLRKKCEASAHKSFGRTK